MNKDLLYPTVAQMIHKQPFTNFTLYSHYPNFDKNFYTPPLSPQPVETQSISTLLKGFFATVAVTVTARAPLNRVKLLLQCQGELIKTGRLVTPYKGIRDCLARIIANEGFLSLWRGNISSILSVFPYQKYLMSMSMHDMIKNSEKFLLLCGSSLAIEYALNYARTRLATDVISKKGGHIRQFEGSWDVWRKTCQSDGIVGNFRGFTAKYVGDVIRRRVYFQAYRLLKPVVFFSSFSAIHQLSKPFVSNGSWQNNSYKELIVTSVAMVSATIAAYPLDTIRRRMMMTSCEVTKYKSSLDCLKSIVRNEGIKSLHAGAGINILSIAYWAGLMVFLDKKVDGSKLSKKKESYDI